MIFIQSIRTSLYSSRFMNKACSNHACFNFLDLSVPGQLAGAAIRSAG